MSAFEKTITEIRFKFDRLLKKEETTLEDVQEDHLECFAYETNGAYAIHCAYNNYFDVIIGCDFNLLQQVMSYLGTTNLFTLVSEQHWRENYVPWSEHEGKNWNYVPFGVPVQNNDKRRRSSGSSSSRSSGGRGKRTKV